MFILDCDLYCDDCGEETEGAEYVPQPGESDSPSYCAECGSLLTEQSLTETGLQTVKEWVETEWIKHGEIRSESIQEAADNYDISLPFSQEFMAPEIIRTHYFRVESRYDGTVIVPYGLFSKAEIREQYDCRNTDIEKCYGIIWRLSASGYMDCTEWSEADSERDARSDMLELYGDE